MFVVDGRKLYNEWRWEQLTGVAVLPGWDGVALRSGSSSDEEFDVLRRRQGMSGKPPDPRVLATDWLKFEAAFAASRGELEKWMHDLPQRLSAPSRFADHQPSADDPA